MAKKPTATTNANTAWFINNVSQGADGVGYGATKAEAIANYHAEYPTTVNDTLRVSKM